MNTRLLRRSLEISPSRRFALFAGLAALAAAGRVSRAQVAVLSSTVEEHTAGPGESYVGRIEIQNAGRTAQVVRLYQTDYHFAADGTSSFDKPGAFARSNSSWVSLQAEQVTVPAHASVNVPYTVTVPRTDSLRGTYWSTIMVEPSSHEAITPRDSAHKPRVGLGMVIRYAVQVATQIGSSGTRAVKFNDIEARQSADTTAKSKATLDAIELDVLNAGERAYRPALWVELYDSQGKLRAKAKQSRGLLYPGCSLRQRFELGALPRGSYKAVIFADTGEESVYASQYTVVF